MRRSSAPPAVDGRGWLVGRYKVGDHVRVIGEELCGTIQSVLRFPRVTAYGVCYDDHTPSDARRRQSTASGTYSEHLLEAVK